MQASDIVPVIPELILLVAACAILLVEPFLKAGKTVILAIALVGLVGSLAVSLGLVGTEPGGVRRHAGAERLGHLLQGAVRGRGGAHGAHVVELPGGAPPPSGRVLRPGAVRRHRHGPHGRFARLHPLLRGPRTDGHQQLPAGRLLPLPGAVQRVVAQVLPHGLVRLGHHAVRHLAGLRGGGSHQLRSGRAGARQPRGPRWE